MDLSNYKGIIDYKPEELYIKVKSGTPIKEITDELEKNNHNLLLSLMILAIYFLEKVTAAQLEELFHAILLVQEDFRLVVFEIIYLVFKELTEKAKL